MMQEQRINARHIEPGRVAVTILSASDGSVLAGQTFFCLTSDVSVDGLSFKVHRPIQKGTVLQLRVELADPIEVFKHKGRVAQCRDDGQDLIIAYHVGVMLLTGPGEIGTAWKNTVERRRALLAGQFENPQSPSISKGARTRQCGS